MVSRNWRRSAAILVDKSGAKVHALRGLLGCRLSQLAKAGVWWPPKTGYEEGDVPDEKKLHGAGRLFARSGSRFLVQRPEVRNAGRKKVDFVHEVQPILRESCYQCHGPDKKKASLRLDLKALALKGGEKARLSSLATAARAHCCSGSFRPTTMSACRRSRTRCRPRRSP